MFDRNMINARKLHLSESLLIELPVPFRMDGAVLWVEAQAFNGITQWLNQFERMTICAPVVPENLVDPSMSWLKVDDLPCRDRLEVVPLPWGYHPKDHYKNRRKVAAIFSDLIVRHKYLLFSNLGWLGAWGNIGASQAIRCKRSYAIWLDWVLHDMPHAPSHSLARNMWGAFNRFMLKRESLKVVRNASLGLFHGRSVYDGYATYCSNPYVVHNIHLKVGDVVSEDLLNERIIRNRKEPFRIVYVGRVDPIKGPLDWIDVIEGLIKSGTTRPIQAAWMGGGPMLDECRNVVAQRGLEGVVQFLGAEVDRGKVLQFMRAADVFLQCHLTPESPRCLIEALMCGLPIVGYESSYASDLVSHDPKAGLFSPLHDVGAVAGNLRRLSGDMPLVEEATIAARICGTHFSDAAVFEHRSQLIKKFL